ncbi:MAG: transcription elongation factor Spt5 [archaeon]
MIYTIKTTVGQENLIVDIIANKVRTEELNVYSITIMAGLKGYILIEADNELTVRRGIMNVPHVKGKGVISKPIPITELSEMLEAKPLMKSINEGMHVELISGPFKGAKAIVKRVNAAKEEVTVELTEAAVKIPVTIKAEHIKTIN